jgi:hypothetical protein
MIYNLIYNPVNKTTHDKMRISNIHNWIKSKISNYKRKPLYFKTQYLVENDFNDILVNDILIWDYILAGKNLQYFNRFKNNIVLLDNPTVLIRKLSDQNPINENLAINHNFMITYLNPEIQDESNIEWKLVVDEKNYIISDINYLLKDQEIIPNNIVKNKQINKEFKIVPIYID